VASTFFISDLHLDPARPAITRALHDFLRQHRHSDALYILGDLFEAWIGDDDDSAIATEVAALLREFSATGTPLFFIQGNRDFLLGQDFCHSVGAQLLPELSVIDLYGEPTLLMHGDTLCTADVDYQKFRKTARSADFQVDFLARSLAERRVIAAQMRKMSKESSSNKAQDIMDVTTSEVDNVMRAQGVQRLIHGHTHRPARHDAIGHGTRWVLGDWAEHGWYIQASANNIELVKFIINNEL